MHPIPGCLHPRVMLLRTTRQTVSLMAVSCRKRQPTCPFHNTLSPNTILPNIDQLIRSFSKRNSLMAKQCGITTKFPRHLHRLSQSLPDNNTHSALTQIAINELFLCPPVLQSDGNSHTGPHLRRYPTGNHIPGQTAPSHANTRPTPHCSD